MLDEKALRKPEWSEGVPIVLGDDQGWMFPRPWLTLFPGRDGDGRIAAYSAVSYGPDHMEQLDRFMELDEDDKLGRIAILFDLGAGLLLKNYDLTDRHLRTLLPMQIGGDSDNAVWDAVAGVVFGRGPKDSGDGSGASSSPTASIEASPSTTPSTSP